MIVSKGNLKVVELVGADKNIPVLDNVLIEKDGTTVGANSRAYIAVSPPSKEIKDKLKEGLGETSIDKGMTISSESVRAVLKAMPKDSMFGGLLEHTDVKDIGDRVNFVLSDGKRKHTIEGKKYPRNYVDYRSVFRDAYKHRDGGKRFVINRKRLIQMLKTIEGIIPEAHGETPIYMEVTSDNELIVRCMNPVNKQRVIGVMGTYQGAEGEWPELNAWESGILKSSKIAK